MGAACSQRATVPSGFDLQVSVADAVSRASGGRVECHAFGGTAPIQYEWTNADTGATALVKLNPERTIATEVEVGRYEIIATDANQQRAVVRLEVRMQQIPCVVSYKVIDATSDTARDGTIIANIERLEESDKVVFLWTSGVVTETSELHDVRPGTYAVAPIFEDGIVSLPFLHACPMAIVRPSRPLTSET